MKICILNYYQIFEAKINLIVKNGLKNYDYFWLNGSHSFKTRK